jgi:hypothetical protein
LRAQEALKEILKEYKESLPEEDDCHPAELDLIEQARSAIAKAEGGQS